MKRLLVVVSSIFLLILLSSCADKNFVNTNVKNSTILVTKVNTISNYFNFNKNTKYVYEGKGNEFAAFNVFVDYISGNCVQLRYNNGGTETVKVLENKNGKLTVLLSTSECYYRENLTQSTSINTEVLLKEPLIKGTTWTLPDKRKRFISKVDVSITTPRGKYKALEVTTLGKNDKVIDYYAPNIGLVKTIFISNGYEVSSMLAKKEENAVLTQTIKFYYPNIDTDKLYYVNKKLYFKTNDITKTIIEKAYKVLPKATLEKVLSANTKIKSLYLNKDNNVYVDFTKEFITEMNAGSGYESMILQSITNTLGEYYGAKKIYLTVEGNPYSSGHIEMKKGDFFTVSLKNSVEQKYK